MFYHKSTTPTPRRSSSTLKFVALMCSFGIELYSGSTKKQLYSRVCGANVFVWHRALLRLRWRKILVGCPRMPLVLHWTEIAVMGGARRRRRGTRPWGRRGARPTTWPCPRQIFPASIDGVHGGGRWGRRWTQPTARARPRRIPPHPLPQRPMVWCPQARWGWRERGGRGSTNGVVIMWLPGSNVFSYFSQSSQ
jgi:hypothetical protein